METTHVRISKSLNERLKTVLSRAGSRLPLGQAFERLVSECLDFAEQKATDLIWCNELRAELSPEQPPATPSQLEARLAKIESLLAQVTAEKKKRSA